MTDDDIAQGKHRTIRSMEASDADAVAPAVLALVDKHRQVAKQEVLGYLFIVGIIDDRLRPASIFQLLREGGGRG